MARRSSSLENSMSSMIADIEVQVIRDDLWPSI